MNTELLLAGQAQSGGFPMILMMEIGRAHV